MIWGTNFQLDFFGTLFPSVLSCKMRLDPLLHSQGHRGAVDGNPQHLTSRSLPNMLHSPKKFSCQFFHQGANPQKKIRTLIFFDLFLPNKTRFLVKKNRRTPGPRTAWPWIWRMKSWWWILRRPWRPPWTWPGAERARLMDFLCTLYGWEDIPSGYLT